MSVGELKREKMHQKEEYTSIREHTLLSGADPVARSCKDFLSNYMYSIVVVFTSQHFHDFF